ncbi:MAG: DUF59 domain-containing protein, partial [Acidimicrobiales bacterium]|nr:DUF59 domain-containing protein [Acidimicrobiales bacterium]
MPTPEQVIEALRPVEDPELHRSIVELDMVRDVVVADSTVSLQIALTVAGCPFWAEIDRRVREAAAILKGVHDLELGFTVMTDAEREALRRKLHGDPGATAGTHQGHGHAEGRAIPFAEAGSTTRVLLIASGKGGVGKWSVTSNLAVALARQGSSVAVVD